MEQLTHITLLSPETAKHLQVEHLEMVVMVILLEICVGMRVMLMVSSCTGPGPVQDLGHELHQVHRRPREGDHQDRPHQLHQVDLVANLKPVMETTIMTAIDFCVCKAAEGVEGHRVPV